MATIKVNSTSMRSKAGTLEGIATTINGYFGNMTQLVESMKSVWEGDAAEKTVNEFKTLSANFEDIVNTIKGYATFLNNAAESYDTTEGVNAQ